MSDVVDVNPEILSGTPVFKGTRVPVIILFEYLEDGMSIGDFIEQYPSITRKQVITVLEEAASFLHVA